MNSCQLNKQLQQILPVYKGVFVCFVSVGMKVRKHVNWDADIGVAEDQEWRPWERGASFLLLSLFLGLQ